MTKHSLLIVLVLCLLSSLVLSCSKDDNSDPIIPLNNKDSNNNIPSNNDSDNDISLNNNSENTNTPFQLLGDNIIFEGTYKYSFINKNNKKDSTLWHFQSDNTLKQSREISLNDSEDSYQPIKVDNIWKILSIDFNENTNTYEMRLSRTSATVTIRSLEDLKAWNEYHSDSDQYQAQLNVPLDMSKLDPAKDQTLNLIFSEDKKTIKQQVINNGEVITTVTYEYVEN